MNKFTRKQLIHMAVCGFVNPECLTAVINRKRLDLVEKLDNFMSDPTPDELGEMDVMDIIDQLLEEYKE